MAQAALTLSGHRQDSRVSGLFSHLLEFNFGTVTVVSSGLERCIATGRKRFGEDHVRIPSPHAATGFTSVQGFCGTRDVGLSCGYSLQQVASPWGSCGRDNDSEKHDSSRAAGEQVSRNQVYERARVRARESKTAKPRNEVARRRDNEMAGGQDCEASPVCNVL